MQETGLRWRSRWHEVGRPVGVDAKFDEHKPWHIRVRLLEAQLALHTVLEEGRPSGWQRTIVVGDEVGRSGG